MSQSRPPRLPRIIEDELDRLGVKHEWRAGTKHWKLLVEGRLAVVYSHGGGAREQQDHAAKRRNLNAVRAIRRVVREARNGQ